MTARPASAPPPRAGHTALPAIRRLTALVLGALCVLASLVLASCADLSAQPSVPLPPAAATPTPSASGPTPSPGTPERVAVTFYAAADNDPPGSTELAYPNSRHAAADSVVSPMASRSP